MNKNILAILMLVAILLAPSVALAEEEQGAIAAGYQRIDDYHIITCGIPFSIEAIMVDGKMILYNKLNRSAISLSGQKITVIASTDGIESTGDPWVVTVTGSYEKNGDLFANICIDCSHESFETQVKMDEDGSVRLVHFTGVTYFVKDLGEDLKRIKKPTCSIYTIEKMQVIDEKSIVGSTVYLRGSVTGRILPARITGIAVDRYSNIRIKIKPGNEFWTDLSGNKLIFNENLYYEFVDEFSLQ